MVSDAQRLRLRRAATVPLTGCSLSTITMLNPHQGARPRERNTHLLGGERVADLTSLPFFRCG
jgi:hypothetical protein